MAAGTTPAKAQAIKTEFATRKRKQLIATIPFLFVILVIATADEAGERTLGGLPLMGVLPVAGIIFVAAVIFTIKNWRCPSCSKYLGKGFSPKFCPQCGVGLQ